ncbi:MAG: sugar-binding domain-containing protein [Tissierellia bacterium]|nr:sugar-binding domain-containing protein [Tissierellia bacterium]
MIGSDLTKLVPEISELYLLRYEMLKIISDNEPIGRRALARMLGVNERKVRKQSDFLQRLNYINITEMGMNITEEGMEVLAISGKYADEFRDIKNLKSKLIKKLEIEDIYIIDANIGGIFNSKSFAVYAGEYIHGFISDGDIIGITGGSTMKLMVDYMNNGKSYPKSIVVPARGSLGKKYEYQANAIVEILADKLGTEYFTINFPDYMDADIIDEIKDDDIKKYNRLIGSIDLLVFGVGRADIMSLRRRLSQDTIMELESRGAVCEAFGNYFDIDGNNIFETSSIGLTLDGYKRVRTAIAVAFGNEKAEPIISLANIKKDIRIIMDLECARSVEKCLK